MAKKGFTLIELVVVLGIISMVIALVLIGLQGAQAAQRDVIRKSVAKQMNEGITQFMNENGALPTYANFTGNQRSSFIDLAITCPNHGFAMNGSCLNTDGLILDVEYVAGCLTQSPYFGPTRLNTCYDTSGGTNGYRFAVFLNNGQPYFFAN